MSEIRVEIRPRPRGWADLPVLDDAQSAVRTAGSSASLVVRGAPGSGRTTSALALLADAVAAGESALLLVPDRVRADALAPRVQALAPNAVRPVRTPASFAHHIVTRWRVSRPDPLGPVELVTGALQDELIAELLESVDAPWPDSLPPQMRAMPAFRAELRDLFARAGEAGMDGAALEAAGFEFDMPQWITAGRLLAAYLEGPQFSVEHRELLRVDLSRIQSLAAGLLDSWEELAPRRGVEVEAPVPGLVVVDDLQDCTPSTIRLLEALHRAGARVLAFADPDVAIAGYRGGEPHLDLRLADALGAPILELGDVKGAGERLRACVTEITSGITQSGPAERRRASVVPGAKPGRVVAHLGGSKAQLGAHLAYALRGHRLHDGIAWEEQAVIVRSSADVEEVSRHLRRGGVPVAGGSRAFDFAAQPTTRAILDLLLPEDEAAAEDRLGELLTSPLVGCDPLEIHRMRLRMRAAGGDEPLSLRCVLADLDAVRPLAGAELLEGLASAQRILAARPRSSGEAPRVALWRLWEATGLAETWREAALAGGPDSAWFDDQLDALVALMRVADVWEQRVPDGDAARFARELLERQVPVDTIARVGVRPPGVAVLTPAQAMGRRFRVVALVGLQDGAWPNTRLRTRTLRADLLADLGAGRFANGPGGARALIDDPRLARRAVLDDERRLLAAAVSRCEEILHIGAVSAENAAPSAFFDLLAGFADDLGEDGPVLEAAPAPLSLAGQVAELRRAAATLDETEDQEVAALLLALLAREGIASADPDTWTGNGPLSSTEDIARGVVALSPSSIERALECPLRWFFGQIGAEGRSSAAQSVGTLVHSIAERLPHGTLEELNALVREELDELGLDEESWEGIAFVDSVTRKVGALASYIAGITGDVEVEKPVRVRIGDVLITGRLDRVERVDGGVRIADLKTGSAVSKHEAEDNAQLAVYQMALREMGEEVVGARLVFLKDAVTLRLQRPLDEEGRRAWTDKLDEVGRIARAATIRALPREDRCARCSFRRSCPARDEGRRTVD